MRQHQILTPKLFDKIVKDEIERQFKLRYLTDQRIPDVYKEATEQELRNEVYSIFFKSFDDILETIGLKLKKRPEIRIWWYKVHEDIRSYRVVRANFPNMERYSDDEEEDDNIIYEIAKSYIPNIEHEKVKYSEDKGDIQLKFNHVNIYFYHKDQKYTMSLNSRIQIIVDYIFTKSIFKPAFEAARGLRYKTIEERRHDGIIEWDMYNYVKTIGNSVTRDLKGSEHDIWRPRLNFVSDRNTIEIGYSGYSCIGA